MQSSEVNLNVKKKRKEKVMMLYFMGKEPLRNALFLYLRMQGFVYVLTKKEYQSVMFY